MRPFYTAALAINVSLPSYTWPVFRGQYARACVTGCYNFFTLVGSNVDQQIGKEFLEQSTRVRHGVLGALSVTRSSASLGAVNLPFPSGARLRKDYRFALRKLMRFRFFRNTKAIEIKELERVPRHGLTKPFRTPPQCPNRQ